MTAPNDEPITHDELLTSMTDAVVGLSKELVEAFERGMAKGLEDLKQKGLLVGSIKNARLTLRSRGFEEVRRHAAAKKRRFPETP